VGVEGRSVGEDGANARGIGETIFCFAKGESGDIGGRPPGEHEVIISADEVSQG